MAAGDKLKNSAFTLKTMKSHLWFVKARKIFTPAQAAKMQSRSIILFLNTMIKFSSSFTPVQPTLIAPTLSPNCTPEQLAAINWTHSSLGNLILEAVAGSGKTYTIIEMCASIVIEAIRRGELPHKIIALMSFNAKVRDELKSRISSRHLSPWVEVNTVHGFAFSAFKNKHGYRKPNSFKLSDLLDPILKSHKLTWKFSAPICQAVSIAKDTGMGLFFDNTTFEWKKLIEYHDISWDDSKLSLGSFINLAADLFRSSTENTDKIDFGDMIWMPLKQELPFPQFDFVFIDEAQDTNATRREVARRMLKPDHCKHCNSTYGPDMPDECQVVVGEACVRTGDSAGRLIAVGDRHQAIYGFTGADNDALDILKKEFSAAELPLSTCFRCSKAVIRHAQSIVPHIQPRCGAIEGSVHLQMPEYNFHNLLFSSGKDFQFQQSAILCRKNAPLISLAFQLIEKQIPCRIEGRDIGLELIKLCKKHCELTETKQVLSLNLAKHLTEQSSKLSPYKYDLLSDKISAIQSILQLPSITSIKELYLKIESIFSDYDPTKPRKLTLSSVHKSKGLEWPTVYLLGRNAWMPSIYATQPWMEEQEQNLIYVAITRAQETLYEITVEE